MQPLHAIIYYKHIRCLIDYTQQNKRPPNGPHLHYWWYVMLWMMKIFDTTYILKIEVCPSDHADIGPTSDQ